jgi:hypothetical protein
MGKFQKENNEKIDQHEKGSLKDIKEYSNYSHSKRGQLMVEQKINEYNELFEIGFLLKTHGAIHVIRRTE